MTLLDVEQSLLPSANPFLNSVCPGHAFLDENLQFSIKDLVSALNEFTVHWPLTDPSSSKRATIDDTYLNIARPPLSRDTNESTTYVANPFHVTHLFDAIVDARHKHNIGDFHIGANINSLAPDPFKEILHNQGCISQVLDLKCVPDRHNQDTATATDHSKHHHNRNFSGNWPKFKILGNSRSHTDSCGNFRSIFDDYFAPQIDSIIDFDKDFYNRGLKAAAKLVVSVHVNVLNIFAVSENSEYLHTTVALTQKSSLPYMDLKISPDPKLHDFFGKRVVELPILRIRWNRHLVATSLQTTSCRGADPIVVLGFDSGLIAVINLLSLHLEIFTDFEVPPDADDARLSHTYPHHPLIPNFVSSIATCEYHDYDLLIVAGFSNGEVAILDPFFRPRPHHDHYFSGLLHQSLFSHHSSESKKHAYLTLPRYTKSVVATDASAAYFKKFDLSSLPARDGNALQHVNSKNHQYPAHLVGHFKISHKAISAIATTIHHHRLLASEGGTSLAAPVIALGSDDGLVRIIDLNHTYNMDYGVPTATPTPLSAAQPKSLITDIISNYFSDRITCLDFSHDNKYLCVAGSGDMIEVFRVSYSSIVHGLHRGPNHPGGKRSRSGTLNSYVSEPHTTYSKPFSDSVLSPMKSDSVDYLQSDSAAPSKLSASVRISRTVGPGSGAVPYVKDIRIVTRLKGHLNVVSSVLFLGNCANDQAANTATANLVYRLVSSGRDGKILVWEFDVKTLPRAKKPLLKPKPSIGAGGGGNDDGLASRFKATSLETQRRARPLVGNFGPGRVGASPSRSRSLVSADHASPFMSNANPNSPVTNILEILQQRSPASVREQPQDGCDELSTEYMAALYREAHAQRLRRHYNSAAAQQLTSSKRIYTIYHPVVDDKLVPCTLIPLQEINLARFVTKNPISGVYIDARSMWCFSKTGDIYKFTCKD